MRLIDAVKKSPNDRLLSEVVAAFAASLAAASLTSVIAFHNEHHKTFFTYIRLYLIGIVAYVAIALFLHNFWRGKLRRMIPVWIMIPVFGSLLFVFLWLTPGIVRGWYDPFRQEITFSDYLSVEADAARSVVIVLSLITLPVTGISYHIGRKVITYLYLHSAKGAS